MDWEPFYVATLAAWHVPILIVGVVAIVLAIARRLPGRARGLLIAGGSMIVLGRLVSAAWYVSIPYLVRDRGLSDWQVVNTVVGMLLTLLEVAALGLLVAAALAGRRTPTTPATDPRPWVAAPAGPPTAPPTGPPAEAPWTPPTDQPWTPPAGPPWAPPAGPPATPSAGPPAAPPGAPPAGPP